jgi:hypothetical protein
LSNEGVDALFGGQYVFSDTKKRKFSESKNFYIGEIDLSENRFDKIAFYAKNTGILSGYTASKILKTEFIRRNNLQFDETIFIHEDENFWFSILLKINKLYCSELFLYNYRTGRKGSIMNSLNFEKDMTKGKFIVKWFRFFKNKNIKNADTKAFFMKKFANEYANFLIHRVYKYNRQKREELPDSIKVYEEDILSYVTQPYKNRLKMCKYFPFIFSTNLFSFIIQNKTIFNLLRKFF